MSNFVKHEIFDHDVEKKKFLFKLRKKGFRKKLYQSDFFFQQIPSKIPKRSLEDLIECPELKLGNFFSRNGNLSPYELLAIASIARARGAKRLLEIGTFDGNTTLQLALNTPEDALIHTIDLPEGDLDTKEPVLESDLTFMADTQKLRRKFLETPVAHKVQQHLGDSTSYDFSQFAKEGSLDFIFIDGGHSYECVKSDTENARKVLAHNGCILWHDFTPHFGGVYQFLHELSGELELIHIEGTNLVIFLSTSDRTSSFD